VNEADCLQIWEVAVKMFNKQSWTADEGVGRGDYKHLTGKRTSVLCNVIQGLSRVSGTALNVVRRNAHEISAVKYIVCVCL
jgi:hypothetical protein